MTALADIGPGKWYFDYSGQTIYVSDDPTGHVVETSVARSAFYGGASSVTVQNLIIEKYAIPAQMGAIGDQYSGAGWTVTHNEVRLNHGAGINAGAYALTTSNFIHDNGNTGMGAGSFALVKDNEVSGSGWAGFSCGWHCGGIKVGVTDSLTFQHNYVHDNPAGIWSDESSTNTVYNGNILVNNAGPGIQHEISFKAKIINNYLRGNGGPPGWLWATQINVQNSQDVEVASNTLVLVASIGNGIGIVDQDRGPHNATGNWVHDNQIFHLALSGISGAITDYIAASGFIFTANHYDYNHYHVPNVSHFLFNWTQGNENYATFQADGQELHGTIDTNLSAVPDVPVLPIAGPGAGLPRPIITSSSHQTANGMVTASYDSSYTHIQFVWSLGPLAATSLAAQPKDTSPVQTSVPAIGLATWNLQPGQYQMSLYATDGVNQSPSTQGTFMIDAPDSPPLHVYPNPWRADRSAAAHITFEMVEPGTKVNIFTVSGHLIRTLTSTTATVEWDLKNSDGSLIASGLYLYTADDPSGHNTRGKLAVIR